MIFHLFFLPVSFEDYFYLLTSSIAQNLKIYIIMKKNLLFVALLIAAIFETNLNAQTVATFDDLSLPIDSFWNGSDMSGGFMNGKTHFYNSYDSQYSSWSGFAYSSKKDSLTPGFANMYSSANGKGYANSDTYAVAYVSSFGTTSLGLTAEAKGKVVDGFYINNGTFSYQSMLNGDAYAKKFSSHDTDWFRVRTYGYFNGNMTDSVDFYLADFRFADSTNAYIIKDWTWYDLSSLGNVDSLVFKMSSSDIGSWGMNTPAYFCMDNFKTMDGVGFEISNLNESIYIYPNPARNTLNINLSDLSANQINIFDATGRLVREMRIVNNNNTIDISTFKRGLYYVQILTDEGIVTKKFIKQ